MVSFCLFFMCRIILGMFALCSLDQIATGMQWYVFSTGSDAPISGEPLLSCLLQTCSSAKLTKTALLVGLR